MFLVASRDRIICFLFPLHENTFRHYHYWWQRILIVWSQLSHKSIVRISIFAGGLSAVTTSASTSGFTFGSPATKPANTSFTFGQTPPTTQDTKSKATFTFGTPSSSSTTQAGFKFGTATSGSPATSSGFKFGTTTPVTTTTNVTETKTTPTISPPKFTVRLLEMVKKKHNKSILSGAVSRAERLILPAVVAIYPCVRGQLQKFSMFKISLDFKTKMCFRTTLWLDTFSDPYLNLPPFVSLLLHLIISLYSLYLIIISLPLPT